MIGRRIGLVLLVIAALAVASCSPGKDRSVEAALGALPVPTTAPVSTSTTAPPIHCDDAQPKTYIPSARPSSPLPPPGAMPAGSAMKTIQDNHQLVVGVDQNTLNLGYFNPEHGRIEGFEVDLARELAGAIFGDPNKVELKAVASKDRKDAIKNGNVDIVIDAVTITCKRTGDFALSSVYYLAHQQLLVRSDSPVKSLDDLDAKPVCVTKGGTAEDFLNDYDRASHSAKPLPDGVVDRSDCLARLEQGTDEAVLADDAILAGFVKQDPYVRVVGRPYTDEPYGVAVNPLHGDLVQFVNGVLDELRADGKLAGFAKDWGLPSPPPLYTAGCIAIGTDSCVPEYSDGV